MRCELNGRPRIRERAQPGGALYRQNEEGRRAAERQSRGPERSDGDDAYGEPRSSGLPVQR